jgi:hypothetical protein
MPYYLLGGGSNVLIADDGIRGLVIYNRCRQVRVDAAPCCVFPVDDRPFLFAESGVALAGLARQSVAEGLTGLEWAVSVPGTVGGAVVNNAGAHGGEVKDNLYDAMVLDEKTKSARGTGGRVGLRLPQQQPQAAAGGQGGFRPGGAQRELPPGLWRRGGDPGAGRRVSRSIAGAPSRRSRAWAAPSRTRRATLPAG